MISVTLVDGSTTLIKKNEIKMIKEHGNKTLIYLNFINVPVCIKDSYQEVATYFLKITPRNSQ